MKSKFEEVKICGPKEMVLASVRKREMAGWFETGREIDGGEMVVHMSREVITGRREKHQRRFNALVDKTVGKVWAFPGSGTSYQVTPSGAYVRVKPRRPWRGKSERRQVIKARREDRHRANMAYAA